MVPVTRLLHVRSRGRTTSASNRWRVNLNESIPVGRGRFFPYLAKLAASDGGSVLLTALESRLLVYLLLHEATWVPVEELARHVWGHHDRLNSACYKRAISGLRRKLRASRGGRILNNRAGQYRFVKDSK
jgi:DNA-binding response OmpR family regulator